MKILNLKLMIISEYLNCSCKLSKGFFRILIIRNSLTYRKANKLPIIHEDIIICLNFKKNCFYTLEIEWIKNNRLIWMKPELDIRDNVTMTFIGTKNV